MVAIEFVQIIIGVLAGRNIKLGLDEKEAGVLMGNVYTTDLPCLFTSSRLKTSLNLNTVSFSNGDQERPCFYFIVHL